MALFSRSKKTETTTPVAAVKRTPVPSRSLPTDRDLAFVLQAPRITEKSVGQGERGVYTFVVDRRATKFQVRDAVIAQFNVTPVKVNIVNKAPRKSHSRAKGRTITQPGMKKAYVYLKKGESISLV